MSERYQDNHKVQGISLARFGQVGAQRCLLERIGEKEDRDGQRYESPVEDLASSAGHLGHDQTALEKFGGRIIESILSWRN